MHAEYRSSAVGSGSFWPLVARAQAAHSRSSVLTCSSSRPRVGVTLTSRLRDARSGVLPVVQPASIPVRVNDTASLVSMLSSRVLQSSLSGASSRHLPSLPHRAVRQPLDLEAEEVEAITTRTAGRRISGWLARFQALHDRVEQDVAVGHPRGRP